MKKLIGFIVLFGLFSISTQAQKGFTFQDLLEWSRGGSTTPANIPNQLKRGEGLKTGERLVSFNGNYYLKMQADGNLAIYDRNNRYQWDAKCGGNGNGSRLAMQTDGNLVVYNRARRATWSSRTHPYFDPKFRPNSMKPVRVVLENDGALVMYTNSNQAVWSSKGSLGSNQLKRGEELRSGERLVSSNGNYYMKMQADGNLAIYDRNDRYQWDAKCGGNGNGSRLAMQTDGNLVVYNRSGRATWSSRTHPYFDSKFRSTSMKPVKVILENNGQLKLYNRANQVVWVNR